MQRTTLRLLILPVLLVGGLVLAPACEEDSADTKTREVRRETGKTLEELRMDVDRGIDPQRKEQLVKRCSDALERLRRQNDPDAQRLADFCDSLRDTNPNTPAAWDDIRNRLTELIARFRE